MSRVVAFAYDRVIDRRILLQLRLLQQMGHEVQLYTVAGDTTDDPQDIAIHRLPVQSRAGMPGLIFGMLARLRRHAPSLLNYAMPRLRPLAWRLMRADPAASYLRLFAPALAHAPAADITIAYDLPMLAVGAVHKAAHGGKLLYDSHELFAEQCFSDFERRMWRQVESRHIQDADAVMTINPSVARELEKRYALADVTVVENAEILPAPFPPRTPYFQRYFGLAEDSVIALFQGALTADRNLERLVESVRAVKSPLLHLVFLGNGPLAECLKAQAKRLGLAGRVHFHPAVAQAKLLQTSAAADFGVIPYIANCLNNALCSPNKLYEFIISGLPVLGSDLPEIRRIITTHTAGELCDMTDASQIAHHMDRMSDSSARSRYRSNVEKARGLLNWEKESEKFRAAIENLTVRE